MSKSGYCAISGEWCEILDEHHIIPREYGGTDGPTIMLSPTVHQTLHRIYNNSQKLDAFANRFPPKARSVVLELARVLQRCKSDFTKALPTQITVQLSPVDMEKLLFSSKQLGIPVATVAAQILHRVLSGQ